MQGIKKMPPLSSKAVMPGGGDRLEAEYRDGLDTSAHGKFRARCDNFTEHHMSPKGPREKLQEPLG